MFIYGVLWLIWLESSPICFVQVREAVNVYLLSVQVRIRGGKQGTKILLRYGCGYLKFFCVNMLGVIPHYSNSNFRTPLQ